MKNELNLYKIAKKIHKDTGKICSEYRGGNFRKYIDKLLKEKETLTAYFLEHTNLKPDEIEIVTEHTKNGQRFYIRKIK